MAYFLTGSNATRLTRIPGLRSPCQDEHETFPSARRCLPSGGLLIALDTNELGKLAGNVS